MPVQLKCAMCGKKIMSYDLNDEGSPICRSHILEERKKMTLTEAKRQLKIMGMWISHRHGEYRVAFPNDEESAYYTNDLDDAVATAGLMFKAKAGRSKS